MQLYKPNKSNKGHAIGLRFNSKDQNLFLSIIKQNGFAENGKGKFNGGKQCLVALGAHEVGGILAVVNGLKLPQYKTDKITLTPQRHEQQYHHESEKQSVKMKFAPYITQEGEVKGLSISIHQKEKSDNQETSYSFWASIDEMFLLEQYLHFVLEHFNTAEYSADKKAREEKFKNRPKTDEGETQEQQSPESEKVEKVDEDEPW